ncbi:uncharacterized protein LOC131052904 [Cryptomeria japonica]|uniref:uncharacterized protein LOC131052904 n=1 Tax=Cryptomeria japonica TaxID=3369 RepID=UPI0027DA280B|nr:uncharacterized protein LOC131052904 [Cryptomeria japonica]
MRKKKNQVGIVKEDKDDSPDASLNSSDNEELKAIEHKSKAKISSPTITDYEKQRQRKIEENKAKLQALGLPELASSLPQPKASKQKISISNKGKRKQDDNDYQPSEEEDDREQSDSSADEEIQQKLPTPRKSTPAKKRAPARPKGKKMKSLNSLIVDKASKEYGSLLIDHEANNNVALQQIGLDEDAALQQALALSMGVSMEDTASVTEASRQHLQFGMSKEKINDSELLEKCKDIADASKISHGKRQKKKTKSINTIQLTEDEVIAYFFYFDEAGKGKITVRDLERVALAHDFMWSKQELSEMINAFDKDCDRQINLEDFKAIAARCNMVCGT